MGRYDFLVLDTPSLPRPPSTFLDAPKRLTQFIEGPRHADVHEADRVRHQGRGAWQLDGVSVLKRVTGLDLISDLSEFFQAFSGWSTASASAPSASPSCSSSDPATTFVVVCGPQGEPINEAVYFHQPQARGGEAPRRRP